MGKKVFWVETWRACLELQGKKIVSSIFCPRIEAVYILNQNWKASSYRCFSADHPRLQILKNSTRSENIIKTLKSLWLIVVVLPGEGLWQWQVLFKESTDFLEDTNFYKLTTVYLRNMTNFGLTDFVLIRSTYFRITVSMGKLFWSHLFHTSNSD